MNERREPMRDDEDEGPTEEQFKQMLQQAVLRHYPNPERKGCLDSGTITSIAEQRLPHEDPRWGHISHCSPCYREFLDHRQEFKAALRRIIFRRRLIVWTGVGAITLLALSAIATLLKAH
jgi:hypothetical protein